jgi:PAS domain S-box-containing protein
MTLLTGALLVFALLYQREAALRNGEQLTDSLSRVIAEQTARTLQSADQSLRLAIVRVEALRDAGELDEAQARAVLREELRGLPFLRALWVLDAQGRIVADSEEGNIGASRADRPYFQAYQREPATNFYIGAALRSRTTGTWMVSVSRPIRDAQGRVQQVIVGALEPPYLEGLWRGIDLGRSGAVALYHRSGQVVARSPVDEALRGSDFSSQPLFTEYLPQAPEGTFVRESGIDGVLRVFSYRELPNYPDLVVAVGSGYDEMLAPWLRFATLTATVFAAAVLVAIALTVQLRRQAHGRQQTEERFRRLAQAVPQVVFAADARGLVEFVSRRWEEVTGRPAAEALAKGWQQLVHPEDRAEMVEKLARMIAGGEELEVEHRLRYRDGSYRWQLLRAVPVRETGEQAVSWFGTATDIDELKQAQQRLHEQAEQLRIAGRLTRMGSWYADRKSQRVTLSEEAAATLDLPPDAEPSLQQLLAMVAPQSMPLGLDVIGRCADDGEPFDLEVEMVTPTGRHVWIRTIGEPIRDASGQIVGMQGAQQDITPRMLMMEEIRRLNAGLEERIAQRTGELARHEALFRTLAEQAPLPFWTVDPHGHVTFLSRAWYELAGGSPPEWHGGHWMQLIHPDDVPAVQQNWTRSMATGEPYTGTRRIRARDGTYHITSYRAVPVRDVRGEILFWVGVDTDITGLMANEAALRLANKQLESFSYSVSHDLQSPLQRVSA